MSPYVSGSIPHTLWVTPGGAGWHRSGLGSSYEPIPVGHGDICEQCWLGQALIVGAANPCHDKVHDVKIEPGSLMPA